MLQQGAPCHGPTLLQPPTIQTPLSIMSCATQSTPSTLLFLAPLMLQTTLEQTQISCFIIPVIFFDINSSWNHQLVQVFITTMCPQKTCDHIFYKTLTISDSQGKVVALDRWGEKWNHLSMTHRLTTNYAKTYCNRMLIVKVIVENVVTFFWTQLYSLEIIR